MHKVIEHKILYFGTPVILVSTINSDGTANIAPISYVWWLNKSCVIGMSSSSKTVENLRAQRECILNLASADMVGRSVLTIASIVGPIFYRSQLFNYVKLL